MDICAERVPAVELLSASESLESASSSSAASAASTASRWPVRLAASAAATAAEPGSGYVEVMSVCTGWHARPPAAAAVSAGDPGCGLLLVASTLDERPGPAVASRGAAPLIALQASSCTMRGRSPVGARLGGGPAAQTHAMTTSQHFPDSSVLLPCFSHASPVRSFVHLHWAHAGIPIPQYITLLSSRYAQTHSTYKHSVWSGVANVKVLKPRWVPALGSKQG